VDGAIDVALNAELRVLYTGLVGRVPSVPPTLTDADGSELAVTWEVSTHRVDPDSDSNATEYWIGKINAPLLANGTYALMHRYASCDPDAGVLGRCGLCTSQTSAVIGKFTTGSANLLGAPKPAVLGAATWNGQVEQEPNAGVCAYTRCMYKFSIAPLGNNERARVYRDGKLIVDVEGTGALEQRIAVHTATSNGYPSRGTFLQTGAAQYQVYAVDSAGNCSTAATLDVPACVVEPDAGTIADHTSKPDASVPDAGSMPDAGVQVPTSHTNDNSGGCALHAHSSAPRSALLWLLALGTLQLVRRRRI
jgi:MYXO-CTERM domain-containing protein